MIAYPIESIKELEVNKVAGKWAEKKIISEDQYLLIKDRHKHGFFIPNLFVRVGLFVLTFILVNAALGLFSMIFVFADISTSSIGTLMIFYGLMVIAGLEAVILNKRTFRAGIDDALLYMALGFLISGVCLIFNDPIEATDNELLFYSLIALPFLVLAAFRYLDNLVTVLAFLCLVAFFFSITSQAGSFGKAITPFLLMGISAYVYFLSVKYLKKEFLWPWKRCLQMIQFVSLLTIYVAGNYFVVRELTIEMFALSLAEGEDIPFAILFQLITLLMPAVYLYLGGKKKDRIIFWCGLLISVLTVLTIKYYYFFDNHSTIITIGGLLLILLSWYCIRYFSTAKNDITSEKEDELISSDAEALILTYSFPHNANETQTGTEFGGGDFGGGGAGGSY